MFKFVVLAACIAMAAAAGAPSPAASDSLCDEARSFNIIKADMKDAMCGGVVYDPTAYRCCGKELRRVAGNTVADPTQQDAGIGFESDSNFCYGKSHVTSRELVCNGKIVSSGKWDKFGRRTEMTSCCRGTTYTSWTKVYTDADKNTNTLTSATQMGCCAGTQVDLDADQDTGAAKLQCCGTEAIDTAKKTCCTSRLQNQKVYDADVNKQCCGSEFVTTDGDKECCGETYESKQDTDGNLLGMCCAGDFGFDSKWGLIGDIMTKSVAPETDTKDGVWTSKVVCGCGNEWIDVSKGWIAPQKAITFTTSWTCTNGKDDVGPCATATGGQAALTAKIGCCKGEQYLTANAKCYGTLPEKLTIDNGNGDTLKNFGASFSGKYLRNNFVDGNWDFDTVDGTSNSPNIYNKEEEYVDAYCGKSAGATAVASVLAAAAAFLAL